MREVDDAHDAEHEVEADADQAEIQPEQNAGDERIDQHQRVAPGFRVIRAASWTRIDRLAGSGFVRIDRDEFEVAVLVEKDLAERRQFADLAADVVERKGAVERLELSGQAEIALRSSS